MGAEDRGDRVTYGQVVSKPRGLKQVPEGLKVFGMSFPYAGQDTGWMGDLYRNDRSAIEHTTGWVLSFAYGHGWRMHRNPYPVGASGIVLGAQRIVLGHVGHPVDWYEHVINAWRAADWIVNRGIPPTWAGGDGDDGR